MRMQSVTCPKCTCALSAWPRAAAGLLVLSLSPHLVQPGLGDLGEVVVLVVVAHLHNGNAQEGKRKIRQGRKQAAGRGAIQGGAAFRRSAQVLPAPRLA